MNKIFTLLFIFCALLTVTVFGQKNYELSTPEAGPKIYVAPEYVRMLPGYRAEPGGTDYIIAKIDPNIVPGVIYIPFGGTPKLINKVFASGGSGSYAYQWQYSHDNSSFYDIGQPGPISQTTWYRRKVTDTECGDVAYTNSIKVIVLTSTLQAGRIAADQNIVSGRAFDALEFIATPSGGDGSYHYRWMSSTDNINFKAVGGNTASYAAAPTLPTWYKVIVSSAGKSVETNVVFINVTGTVSPGSICCDASIQAGEQPGLLTSRLDAGGGLKPYTYQWEMMDDIKVGWKAVDGSNNETYQPPVLEKTTRFRRQVTDNSGQKVTSNEVEITVGKDPLVRQPVALNVNGNKLQVYKGSSGSGGKWEWYDDYKGDPFKTTNGNKNFSTDRSRRYRVRTEHKEKTKTGTATKNGYFVSVPVHKKETLKADETKNYVVSYSPFDSVKTREAMEALPLENQGAVVQYFDGFGRPIQTVAANQSYYFNDLVTGVEYDNYGRKTKDFIPSTVHGQGAFVNDISQNINDFYDKVEGSAVDGLEPLLSTDNEYSYTHYESSPLNRVEYVEDPKGGKTSYEYGTNSQNSVMNWKVDENNNLERSGYYDAGQLFYLKTTDAEDRTTEEYKDKNGRVVLKLTANTASTYYVYDDYGLLRYVLSPKATEIMTGNSNDSSSSEIKGLSYYYEYDHRHRVILKQLPGADPVYLVYDARDRLILTQDGNTRYENSQKWLYTLYDNFNRPTDTGWWETNLSLQQVRDEFAVKSDLDETWDLPGSGTASMLTETVYDEYPEEVSSSSIPILPDDNVKGLVTQNTSMVLGTNQKVKSNFFYDNKYRLVQNIIQTPDITQIVSNNYDFSGNIKQTEEKYSGKVNVNLIKTYSYDHAGRLERTTQNINGDDFNGEVVVAESSYNELGLLVLKKLHSADTSFVQNIDYLYDVRGWLKKINNLTESTNRKLYAQELNYYANGNIESMQWKNTLLDNNRKTISTNRQAYNFSYDDLNRLTGAKYNEFTSGTNEDDATRDAFSTSYTYDNNGNILQLQRKGNKNLSGNIAQYSTIDNLSFDYLTNSNQLQYITDNATSSNNHELEFKNGSGNYIYDDNGNATFIPHKMASITYNYLNLPKSITVDSKETINYLYDASGMKLSKSGMVNSYYLGNVIKIGEQEIVFTGEGRVVKIDYKWHYEYDLKDHLGNTRVSFGVDTTRAISLQHKDYYPFGLEMAKWYETDPNATKYLYNGKELQDDYQLNWYDYGARFYDPVTARFTTPDPHAENYYSWSPYHYAANNPMLVTDPTGMDWFVNRENGNVLFVNGVEELTEELIERYGEGYDHFGSDDMFGNEVTVEGEDGNILDRPDYEFGPTGGEEFMESQGYNKGERVQMEKTEFETNVYNDGTLGVRTISENSEVQVGDSEITYVKPSEFGKKENTTTNSYRDDNFTLKKENYSVVKRPGTKVKNRYRSPFQVVKDLLGIGTNIVSNKAEKK